MRALLLFPLAVFGAGCGDPNAAQGREEARHDIAHGLAGWATYNYRCGRELHVDVHAETGLPLRCMGECGDRSAELTARIEAYNAVVQMWLARGAPDRPDYRPRFLNADEVAAAVAAARPFAGGWSVETKIGFRVLEFEGGPALTLDGEGPIRVFDSGRDGVALVLPRADLAIAYDVREGLVLQIWQRDAAGWKPVDQASPR
jgi:hypothetical protein